MPKRLAYADAGRLSGPTPTGVFATISHNRHGQSGFEILRNGEILNRSFADRVWDELGMIVREKLSGAQLGYPREAVLRSVWRYFVDRYNDYDSEVENSRSIRETVLPIRR